MQLRPLAWHNRVFWCCYYKDMHNITQCKRCITRTSQNQQTRCSLETLTCLGTVPHYSELALLRQNGEIRSNTMLRKFRSESDGAYTSTGPLSSPEGTVTVAQVYGGKNPWTIFLKNHRGQWVFESEIDAPEREARPAL